MAASLFGTGGTVNVNVNGTLVPQSFVATDGQVLFNLSGWTYVPGTNSLLVFINGQRQVVSRDFTETSTSSFTLLEGCVAGDFVDVIGFPEINLTAVNSGSVNLGGTYTLADYLIDGYVDVRAYPYNAKGDGVTDDTVAIQTCLNANVGKVIRAPATSGGYLVTDTLSIPTGTQFIGDHLTKGIPSTANGTKILFKPTTPKSLFVPAGAPSLYRTGNVIAGFYIVGNSVDSSGNSIYVADVYGWNKSRLEFAATGFRSGVRCYGTINNNYNVQIANTYIQAILYDGGYCTTDVWEAGCHFANGVIWCQTNGTNLNIRFEEPVVESFTTYGLNLVKESYGFSIKTPHFEDVPSANVATNAALRVGYDGTTLSNGGPQLVVGGGGELAGRNAGGIGSALDVDYTDGVIFGDINVTRFTNGIKTSTNTQTQQIISKPWTASSVSFTVTDPTKIIGHYPVGVITSGTRNAQNAYLAYLTLLGTLNIQSGATASTGTTLVLGNGNSTTVGAAGGASALPATPLGYLHAYIGTQLIKIPYYLP